MSPERIKSAARWILATIGGFFVGWAASRGYQWSSILEQILTSETAIGLLSGGIAMVWGWLSKSTPNLVAIVDALAKEPGSPVKGVVMESTPEGKAIALALPGSETVAAGSAAATEMAKPR